jgi:hypothetical protein
MTVDKSSQLLEFAELKSQECATWVELHNAIYGIGGKFGELFPTAAARTTFAGSEEFKAIAALIESLPTPENVGSVPAASSGRFVLRLPRSLHASLSAEAEAEGVSLNQLCLAKLAVQLRAMI